MTRSPSARAKQPSTSSPTFRGNHVSMIPGTAMMQTTKEVLAGKYPAKQHARKVATEIKISSGISSGVIYLASQKTQLIEDNDEPVPFRQRRFFFYLSGVEIPDAALTYDIAADHLTLFIPPVDPDQVIWSGLPRSSTEAKSKYDVDEVLETTALQSHLLAQKHAPILTIEAQIPQNISLPTTPSPDTYVLKTAIETARVTKDAYEVAMMQSANDISSDAHHAVMHAVSSAPNERDLEAIFLAKCIASGARNQAYHSIVAGGTNAATLHYTPNDAHLDGCLNLLLDAGSECDCYASDITRTFPISGKFSPESRAIYEIVLRMQKTCIALLRDGVRWEDVHMESHRVLIDGLLALGILRGDASSILAARTSVAFYPHGLGHYLGMDTHDVGGNPDYTDKDPMFRYLRIRGRVPTGAIVTVEPGIYFCRFIIEPYLRDHVHKAFIDEDVLGRYWSVGGVRIEDNLLIEAEGSRNLTSAVKEVDDVERMVRSGLGKK